MTTADVLAAAKQHGFYLLHQGGTRSLWANEAYILAHAPRTEVRIPDCAQCQQPFVVPAKQTAKLYCSERCYFHAKAHRRRTHA